MIPKLLRELMNDLQKMPGIGEKTAERLALFLVSDLDEESILTFSDHLKRLKTEIKTCPICHMLMDEEGCMICQNELRDKTTLMVVADPKDVFVFEKMRTYDGVYHVLGGLIDFSRGITDQDLNIDTLSVRIPEIKELIIATNGTVEGEMTAKFLKSLYESEKIVISRLASGLPVGADLRYADELTLSKAVENRLKY